MSEFSPFGADNEEREDLRRLFARKQQVRRSLQLEERALSTLLKTMGQVEMTAAVRREGKRLTGHMGLRFDLLRSLRPDFPVHLEVIRLGKLAQLGLTDLFSPKELQAQRFVQSLGTAREHAPAGLPCGVIFGPLVGIPGNLLIFHELSRPPHGASGGAWFSVENERGVVATLEPYSSFVSRTLPHHWSA